MHCTSVSSAASLLARADKLVGSEEEEEDWPESEAESDDDVSSPLDVKAQLKWCMGGASFATCPRLPLLPLLPSPDSESPQSESAPAVCCCPPAAELTPALAMLMAGALVLRAAC